MLSRFWFRGVQFSILQDYIMRKPILLTIRAIYTKEALPLLIFVSSSISTITPSFKDEDG